MNKIELILILVIAASLLSLSASAITGYCGNGVLNYGEKCESPGTQDNTYCPESATSCLGSRLGVRPAYGDCSAVCKCSYDKFTYSCVKGSCGAQCASKEDCPQSAEKCFGYKLATREQYGMCHYNCNCQEEPYSTLACVKDKCGATCARDCDCPQTTEKCIGSKTATRPECGKCLTSSCQCSETSFTAYKCVAGSCGAQCDDNTDCAQDTKECKGTMLGTRNSYGLCKGDCNCQETPYQYQCVPGECGATCSKNTDCDDHNPNTADSCGNCTCIHTPLANCGDGVINRGEQCELPGTQGNSYCTAINSCYGRRYGERPLGDCNMQCKCVYNPYAYACVVGECGAQCATPADCPETSEKCFGNKLATRSPYAICHYNCNCQEYPFSTAKCVKGECDAQCAADSDCSQDTLVCNNHMAGTRLATGKCLSGCMCQETQAASYKCVKGECGAQCAADSDCAASDKCSGCMCVCKTCQQS